MSGVIDTNILLYAANQDAPEYQKAVAFLINADDLPISGISPKGFAMSSSGWQRAIAFFPNRWGGPRPSISSRRCWEAPASLS